MAVFRTHKTKDYTVLSNYHFKDTRLSLKAKGLLSLCLSLPETWQFSVRGLASLSADGVDSTQSALQELERYKYLKRTRCTEHGKFAGYNYDLYEKPYDVEDERDESSALPYTENPYTEEPYTEKPCTENPAQLNTNISSTEEIKYLDDVLGTESVLDNKPGMGNEKGIGGDSDGDLGVNDFTWLFDMWNSSDVVTAIRTIREGTLRYKNVLLSLKAHSEEEIRQAYDKIAESKYLSQQKPTFDWFINPETDTITKLLEDAYKDWSPLKDKKKTNAFNNFKQHEYDWDELEKKLFNMGTKK